MEDNKKNEKKWKMTSKKIKNGRRPQAQFSKINLSGCDIILK